MDWKEKAEEIVGARLVEMDKEWHETKIAFIAGHLQAAYEVGVKDGTSKTAKRSSLGNG